MRHRKAGLKLNRTSSHRKAMFRNMVTSLFKHTRIRTTDAKAKELRRWADNLITLAKRGDLHARRQALAIVREKEVVHKLFEEAQDKYGAVSGGYTRVVKVGRRPGDAASVSIVELIELEKKKKKTRKRKGKAPAAAKIEAKDKPDKKDVDTEVVEEEKTKAKEKDTTSDKKKSPTVKKTAEKKASVKKPAAEKKAATSAKTAKKKEKKEPAAKTAKKKTPQKKVTEDAEKVDPE